MNSYHNAQICLNGHVVTPFNESETVEIFCSKCGAETISRCLSCGSEIRGVEYSDYDYLLTYHKPFYCPNCGNPYPWTQKAIDAATILISEEENLESLLKSSAIELLPSIISETPNTNIAVIRIKKCLASAGKFTSDALRQFIIDFGCEVAKKSIGL